jgi:hypothetical protein
VSRDSRSLLDLARVGGVLIGLLLSSTPTWAQRVSREIVVKIRSGQIPSTDDLKVDRLAVVEGGTLYRVRSSSRTTEQLLADFPRAPGEVYREPSVVLRLFGLPNDPLLKELWGLRNFGQSIGSEAGCHPTIAPQKGLVGADIQAEFAWPGTTNSALVVVAVVDSGVDYTHPELNSNMWRNPGSIGNPNCAAGTYGYNAITDTCDPSDAIGHGTHIAGTIGAIANNNEGVAGINWTTQIMALKFIDSASGGSTADAVKAIDFAILAKQQGVNVRVLSSSWGNESMGTQHLIDIIRKANDNDILFVTVAGNYNVDIDTAPVFPAAYGSPPESIPNIVVVAATDNRDRLSNSNYGLKSVHLGAPGQRICSTEPGGGYGYRDGSSMAVAHVSGTAAFLLAAQALTTSALKARILGTVDVVNGLAGKTATGGRLNLCRASGSCRDFTVAVRPVTVSLPPSGGFAEYTVSVRRSGGFSDPVTLSLGPLPPHVSLSPPTTNVLKRATKWVRLRLKASARLAPGSYEITITGKGGSPTRERAVIAVLVKSP